MSDLDPLADLIHIQRLAVEIARNRGLDPDTPRNLTGRSSSTPRCEPAMTVLANARLVLPNAVQHGWLRIDGGRIADIGVGAPGLGGVDPGLGTGSSDLCTSASDLGTSASDLGTSTSGHGTNTSGLGANASDFGASTSNLGASASGLGAGDSDRAEAGSAAPDEADVLDMGGRYVVPGFVDMHLHGGAGHSYQSGRAEDARQVVKFHRAHGTTTLTAGLVTGSTDEMLDAVSGLAELASDGLIAGVHLEGPYIAVGRCGAHEPSLLREPDLAEFRRLVKAGGGHIRMITLAPELPGGLDLVRAAVDEGVVAAVGHTDGTAAQVREAFDAGARVATHLFNAMRPLHHREGGPIVAALNDARVTVELINDGVHIDTEVARLTFTAAGPDRVALITDSMAAAGMGDGSYTLGVMNVEVKDGRAMLAGGTSIAGSTITMADGFRRAVTVVGVPIEDAARSAALIPARALGLDDRIGSLEIGKEADLVVLSDDMEVEKVMKGGRWS
ncbi:N-acetylglucosamine-6-phosphate deacetylase [Actinomadura sp. 6N118]|uniref:N-acetylglucosamine-6-phosphate deacetylase n=1 Tax=Actinomadura sp. 6N118 TaxID=3375151 RepID=UPI0037B59FD4